MFSECNGNCPNMSGELDQYLKIQRGMKPGNNFKQMMQSRKFGNGKPGFGMGQGETGPDGTGGYAMSAAPEAPVLGNESRPNSDASRKAGERGLNKQAADARDGAAQLGATDVLQDVKAVTRDSRATEGESSLDQYRDLVDRYFKAITK